jgi:porin
MNLDKVRLTALVFLFWVVLTICWLGRAFADQEDSLTHHPSTHNTHINQASELEEGAISFNGLLVNDSWANARGGNYRGVGSIGNVNLILEFDTEKLHWWNDGRFVFYGLGIYGRRPSLSVGDYQFTSSIDAYQTIEPYEVFYEQHFGDQGSNVLIGIHDFTTEFAVLDYATTLLNSSFATPSTITQLPYSFYPFTGLGLRTLLQFESQVYLLSGVYDGTPAGQTHERGLDLGLSKDDGMYSIAELGYQSSANEVQRKLALGVWYNSALYTDMNGEYRGANYGSYLIGQYALWRESNDGEQGLGVFAQLGQAPSDRNFNPWYGGVGLRYRGLINSRPSDTLALGFNVASISQYYRSAHPGTDLTERIVELSYRAQVSDWLTLTPDVQFVVDPGAKVALDNALIFAVRSEIKL